MKKYSILTNDKISFRDPVDGKMVTVYRIIADKDFKVEGTIIGVKTGTLGGFIESESNLSQNDNCWVAHNAKIWGAATMSNNSILISNASVHGDTHLDQSMISDGARVFNSEVIKSQVYGNSVVDNCQLDFSIIKGTCQLKKSTLKETRVWEAAFIKDSIVQKSMVGGTPQIINSTVENCKVYGETTVKDRNIVGVELNEVTELFQSYPPLPSDVNEF